MKSLAALLLRLSPIVDALLLAAVITAVSPLRFPADRFGAFFALLTVPGWLFLLRFFGVYESQRIEGLAGVTRKVLSAHATASAVIVPAVWLFISTSLAGDLLGLLCTGCLVIVVEKWGAYGALHVIRSHGFDARNVCVIGTVEDADALAARFRESASWGFRIVCVGAGAVGARQFVRYPGGEPLGESLAAVLESEVVDEVLLTVSPERLDTERDAVGLCAAYGVISRLLLKSPGAGERGARLQDLCGEPAVTLGGPAHDDELMLLKRVLDVVLSLALLLVLLPLLITVGLLVKLSSPGPIVFRQRRTGLYGRQFTLYKFRTMVDRAEALLPSLAHRNVMKGPIFKDPDDVRVTRIGRLLRRFSIDELPQLWNVVRGDMSLVGPRPLPVYESAVITGEHRRRFSMRPGITCLWQVNGRSTVDYVTWMTYDLQYVDGWSLALDVKVLLKTLPVVLTGRGAC